MKKKLIVEGITRASGKASKWLAVASVGFYFVGLIGSIIKDCSKQK